MANLQRLEANVMRSLEEGLDSLPVEILSRWKDNVLSAIFLQARTVMSGGGTKQPD